MKIVFFTIFFLGSDPASMVNQKNLSKVQYSFIFILKKLHRFSKNIPIIKDNSRPAAFVPYVVQGYIFTNQYSTFELALLVTMQVRVVWAIYHGSSIFRFLAIYRLFVQNIELRCCWSSGVAVLANLVLMG